MTAPIHSIWLIPAPEDAGVLSGLLSALSDRFGTPLFTPHLTIAGDTDRLVTTLAAAIVDAAREVQGFSEAVAAIETSEAFFRSFYARFAVVPPLVALKRRLDGQATEAFMPHVSLLYGPVPAGPKAQAAAEVAGTLTGRAIRFDRLCVVTSGQDVPIDQWRVVEMAWLA